MYEKNKFYWFDDEIQELKKIKNTKYFSWLNDKSTIKWEEYVSVRNNYNKMIKAKKCQFTKSDIMKASNDQKKILQCLNKLISKRNDKTSDVISIGDTIYTEESSIANELNGFFVNSIVKINNDINVPEKRIKI